MNIMDFKALRQDDFLKDKVLKGHIFLEKGKGKIMHPYKTIRIDKKEHMKFSPMIYISKYTMTGLF